MREISGFLIYHSIRVPNSLAWLRLPPGPCARYWLCEYLFLNGYSIRRCIRSRLFPRVRRAYSLPVDLEIENAFFFEAVVVKNLSPVEAEASHVGSHLQSPDCPPMLLYAALQGISCLPYAVWVASCIVHATHYVLNFKTKTPNVDKRLAIPTNFKEKRKLFLSEVISRGSLSEAAVSFA